MVVTSDRKFVMRDAQHTHTHTDTHTQPPFAFIGFMFRFWEKEMELVVF
jgi:hypothetical protein